MNLLESYIRFFLIEGRIDDLKRKYPNLNIEVIAAKDPSKNNKYLNWMVKQIAQGADEEKVYSLIQLFDKKAQRLKNKDINSYSVDDLEAVLSNLGKSNRERRAEVKAEGAKRIGGNSEYDLFVMLSRQACFQYGSNTKWCITSKEENHFDEYAQEGVLHYFAIRKEPIGDSYDKVAISTYLEDEEGNVRIEINDAENNYLDSFNADLERQAIKDSRKRKRTNVIYRLKNDPSSFTEEEILTFIKSGDANQRYMLANVLDPSYLPKMMNDESMVVKMRVANRIDPSYLPEMMNDENGFVRVEVAKRIDPSYLTEMMNDPSSRVREMVAIRIDPSYFLQMWKDNNKFSKISSIIHRRIRNLPLAQAREITNAMRNLRR